jgi:arabinose-5-phosphate isomerase
MKKNADFLKKTALNVIRMESEAVEKLSEFIDDTFVEIVNLIYSCKGRIIVSGVGKSAIIATKIVATFNSTGTHSAFMHSADAAHGDLGMIQKNDIVMFVSKSGNTAEVKRLVPFIKEMGNPIVAMISNSDSFLAHHADYILLTPIEKEACSNNLAPTCSTTAQLAMGDAIAMTLSSMRGFTEENFGKYHPGGSLGKRLYMRVEDIFDPHNLPSVDEDESIQNTIINISSHRLGATVVLSRDGLLEGIITDGDIRRMVERGVPTTSLTAKDIMSPHPKTIVMGSLAVEAFNIMESNKITSVIVLKNGIYVGLIHIHDIIREGIS